MDAPQGFAEVLLAGIALEKELWAKGKFHWDFNVISKGDAPASAKAGLCLSPIHQQLCFLRHQRT